MTDSNPLDEIETELIGVYVFRCSKCRARAVPVDGYGTTCHKAHCDGEYEAKTGETKQVEVSQQQKEQFNDAVIAE